MKDLKKTFYLGFGLGIKLLAGLFAVKLCAQVLGPESFGLTGQLSSLISVITLLAGAGVSVGVTKVYAGTEFPVASRPDWIKAARWIVLTSASLLSILFLLSSNWVTEHVFDGFSSAGWLLAGLIFSIFPIAYAGIGQGRINGSHRDDLYAWSLVLGSGVGLLGLWALAHYLGDVGVLLGMVWLVLAQALVMTGFGRRLDRRTNQSQQRDPELKTKIRFLLGYGVLSIAAGAIIPLVYIFIRLLVQEHDGNRIFGLWQATLRISEAYSQLPLMLLSVVLFARFASQATVALDPRLVRKTYLFMASIMIGISAFVYLGRSYWIPIVFTHEFTAMEAFVPWQLSGDALRILSYVGTTILAARGAVKLCLVGEFIQGGLLLVSSSTLVPKIPIYGAFYAYILSYGIYFLMTIVALYKIADSKLNCNT